MFQVLRLTLVLVKKILRRKIYFVEKKEHLQNKCQQKYLKMKKKSLQTKCIY